MNFGGAGSINPFRQGGAPTQRFKPSGRMGRRVLNRNPSMRFGAGRGGGKRY